MILMDLLYGHRQGVNTVYVEEPAFDDNQDSDEVGNSMTNELSIYNLISDLVSINDARHELYKLKFVCIIK